MSIKFDVKIPKALGRNVKIFKRKFPNLLDKATRTTATFAEARVARDTPVDTGKAKRNWNIKRIKHSVYLLFNRLKNPPYPSFLEYGTKAHGPKKGKFMRFPIIKGNTIVRWVTTKKVRGIKARKMIQKNIRGILKRYQRNLFVGIRIAWSRI